MRVRTFLMAALLATASASARAAVLQVGDGKQYPNINMALKALKQGDEISVFASKNPKAYDQTVALIKVPGVYIHAADLKAPIKINGAGYVYSGDGRIPRAIFQFEPGATGCTLEGFELTGAHNKSHNGAGVRINQANDITIRHCTISGNDMGIMSNGSVKEKTGANQLIEFCLIEKNGDFKEPGQNHNLYLGGTCVTVRGCEIASSLTGHNLKSRAHQNWIEYNYIHDSANRELDLVDGEGNTDAAGSDTVLLGNIIQKGENEGNHTVIQFGKDGKADHTGTLWAVHNTIISSYGRPIVDVSAPGATCVFLDNLFVGKDKAKTPLMAARNGAKDAALKDEGNAFVLKVGDKADAAGVVDWEKIGLPWEPFGKKAGALMQYAAGQKIEERADAAEPGAAGRLK